MGKVNRVEEKGVHKCRQFVVNKIQHFFLILSILLKSFAFSEQEQNIAATPTPGSLEQLL